MATVQISQKEVRRALQSLNVQVRKAVDKGILSAAHQGRGHLMRKTPVDTGELRASWRLPRKNLIGYELHNSAPHAGIVEEGARPHPVSFEGRVALEQWARRHFPEADPGEHQQIAQGIARKLETQGQKPTYFIRSELKLLGRMADKEIFRMLRMVQGRKK